MYNVKKYNDCLPVNDVYIFTVITHTFICRVKEIRWLSVNEYCIHLYSMFTEIMQLNVYLYHTM